MKRLTRIFWIVIFSAGGVWQALLALLAEDLTFAVCHGFACAIMLLAAAWQLAEMDV